MIALAGCIGYDCGVGMFGVVDVVLCVIVLGSGFGFGCWWVDCGLVCLLWVLVCSSGFSFGVIVGLIGLLLGCVVLLLFG